MDGMNAQELARLEELIRQNEHLRQEIAALQAIIVDLLSKAK